MSRLNVSNLFNENEDGAPVVSGISTFSSPNYFVPPSGSTAQRPSNPGEGMIRFNTDSGHLEYYTGTHWADVITNNNELGNQLVSNSSGGTGTRGLFAGGDAPGVSDIIDYVSISTLGNAQDFGNLTPGTTALQSQSVSSSTRGLIGGGKTPSVVNTIQYVTFSSTGNAQDFGGDLTRLGLQLPGFSNETRGIWAGGYTPGQPTIVDTIDYVTIASTGVNAQDFGNLTEARRGIAAFSSSVRGVLAGGNAQPALKSEIQYLTISTTGNAQVFGDLTGSLDFAAGASNSTRGIVFGGRNPSKVNIIEFVTIASTGDAQDFGDANTARTNHNGTSSSTRAIFGGGDDPSPNSDVIEFVTISSTGNAIDFGDLTAARNQVASFSNGHGGL
tara:strand:+ start:24 stop:1184 length:1161 start_codon:yes stop_codon:yes gene_type:complete